MKLYQMSVHAIIHQLNRNDRVQQVPMQRTQIYVAVKRYAIKLNASYFLFWLKVSCYYQTFTQVKY